MPLCETFSSIQGEIQGIGKHCFFVRLFGCNLGSRCTVDCDTLYSWDAASGAAPARHVDPGTLVAEISGARAWNVVMTGGEPLLHQASIATVIRLATSDCKRPPRWYIETNGTIKPDEALARNPDVFFNVSPKILPFHPGTFPIERSAFKLVVDRDSLERVSAAVSLLEPVVRHKTYLMPRSKTRAEYLALAPDVATWCAARGLNFGPRLHLLAWDGKRGT